ncbi:Rho GTPase activating protein [Coemansia sp. RSA 552]|nr:Rho GTPase activating protein [Coemansia sp. RSA 552]
MALPSSDIPGDGAGFDTDVDVIHIMQERDAYKQETEKLRKIIERQRYIITSLQDQLARKQSVSSAVTPELMERPVLAPAQPAAGDTAPSALGLSAMDVCALPGAAPVMRKASQDASTAAPPVPDAMEAAVPRPHPQQGPRPWAKSTRLSEIYADYSARHNSTVPMFKNVTQQQDEAAGGSSFVESLKSSVQRTEWPAEWGAEGDHDYVSDASSDHRAVTPVLRPVDDQPAPVAEADLDFVETAPAHMADPHGARYNQRVTEPATTAAVSAYTADAGVKLASPTSQIASENLVLRPISTVANLGSATSPPTQNGRSYSTRAVGDDEENWRASRIADYEYGPVEKDRQNSAQTTPQQRFEHDSSFGTAPGADVRWAGDPAAAAAAAAATTAEAAHTAVSTNPFENIRRAREGSSQSAEYEPGTPAMRSNSSPGVGTSRYSESQAGDGQSGDVFHGNRGSPGQQGTSSLYSVTSSTNSASISMNGPLTSLQNVDVQIKDSRVKIDERGKEVNVYMVDVIWRKEISGLSLQEILVDSQQADVVLWTVEKRYSDFLYLNSKLRHVIHRERLLDKLERLPDKDIFQPNAPTKSDRRKLWFERYLQKALSLAINDKRPLLEFLSTNRAMEPEKSMPILLGHKEGFLIKKGKNFGGWKRRYYVCKSNKPVLEYSELPGGTIIGTINLSGAVVKTGRSRVEESPSLRVKGGVSKETDMFRHAFLIEERPKREGKDPIAHPLWADSDRERDEWVMALRYVIVRDADGPERAMKEVTKLVKHAKSKEAKPPMIHQIHTSITHEQGVRQSIDQARRRDEQEGAGANQRKPSDARSQGPGNKFGSPLSKQMWPATGSLDNMAQLSAASPAEAAVMEGDSDSIMEELYNSSRAGDRPRSLSYPPAQDDGHISAAKQRAEAAAAATAGRPAPAAVATTLSTSFGGHNESASDQAEGSSSHRYVPSEISTIESSLYSSHNGHMGGSRPNDDGRNSYASMPDSPRSPTLPQGPLVHAAYSERSAAEPSAAAPGAYAPAEAYSSDTYGHHPSSTAAAKSQFTKNSVGRIVHEEEIAPDLPAVTPHVTDDILGVGRQGHGRKSSGSKSARSREDKKRGRITFMWGKRKPAESEPPVPEVGTSGTSASGGADAPTPTAPRRLRRGSTTNDSRSVLTKNPPFKGPVFAQSLERVVEQTRVREHYRLPAVVYRCIEYLDAKKAWLEEGIYRQSGSSLALTQLRKEFNANRDYNLLKLSKPPDVHAVASLLKAYLRELPENILTARLYQDFVQVMDLVERHDRVYELGRLVSDLPLANYTLLRALTAHLIRIVQKASTNRMTLRNIGIVFSPSLGIPVGVFSLLMVEFEYIFWVNDSGAPEPKLLTNADASQHQGQEADQQLSASVPSGMNRAAEGDARAMAGNARADVASFASENTQYGLRPAGNSTPAFQRRPPALATEATRQRAQDNTYNMAAMAPAPWYTQPASELAGQTGLAHDLSRYPGMPPPANAAQQGQSQPTGRSNRNSIQYKVGAPRELISQEAGISVPATINEADLDDDSDDRISASDDPMMRLNRYASSSLLTSGDNTPTQT